MSSAVGLIQEPADADVLCGRGRAIRLHPGNQRYMGLIHDQKQAYTTAQKGSKMDVVKKVVQMIREEQGRFLQKSGLCWVEIGQDKAVLKTSQAFRDLRTEDTSSSPSNKSSGDSAPEKKSHSSMNYKINAPAGRFALLLDRLKAKTPKLASSATSEEDEGDASSTERSEQEDVEESSDSEGSEVNDGGDVSETETEDSFPMYRSSKS